MAECGVMVVETGGTLPDDPEKWADSDYWEEHNPCILTIGHDGEHQRADDAELARRREARFGLV